MNTTFLSWKPHTHTHTHTFILNPTRESLVYFLLCDQRTSEDGGDNGGQQAAGVDGQVEDGEEGAPLLLLLDTGKLHFM